MTKARQPRRRWVPIKLTSITDILKDAYPLYKIESPFPPGRPGRGNGWLPDSAGADVGWSWSMFGRRGAYGRPLRMSRRAYQVLGRKAAP